MKKSVLPVIALAVILIGCLLWLGYPSAAEKGNPPGSGAARANGQPQAPGEVRTKVAQRHPAASPDDPALKGVSWPIARRYLAYQVAKNGRLAKESHTGSIVHSAFVQAWVLTSRMNLTEAQQDQLAEFLLSEDWLRWDTMDSGKIRDWAEQILTAEQQAVLKDFLAEQKQGAAEMEKLKRTIRRIEHGKKSEAEILGAEMATLKAFFSEDAASGSKPPVMTDMDEESREKHAAYVKTEQAFRFYNVLADRTPMTPEQHEAVYAALRQGSRAPVNPYDYQSLPPDRAETKVRADTAWLGELITGPQYETYVSHFLAEIEIIRFQNSR
jgi:hypothetical protein